MTTATKKRGRKREHKKVRRTEEVHITAARVCLETRVDRQRADVPLNRLQATCLSALPTKHTETKTYAGVMIMHKRRR